MHRVELISWANLTLTAARSSACSPAFRYSCSMMLPAGRVAKSQRVSIFGAGRSCDLGPNQISSGHRELSSEPPHLSSPSGLPGSSGSAPNTTRAVPSSCCSALSVPIPPAWPPVVSQPSTAGGRQAGRIRPAHQPMTVLAPLHDRGRAAGGLSVHILRDADGDKQQRCHQQENLAGTSIY